MKSLLSTTLIPAASILLALGASTLAGCSSKHGRPTERSSSVPTAHVRVHLAEDKPRAITEEVVGTVRAKFRATLEARMSGRIDQMPVILGDKVNQGQLIARLDAAEIAARLEQSEASLELAERDWKRISSLFEQQSVTRVEFDSAQSRWRVAKGALAEAKAMMSYAEILAPFAGVVTKKWADAGDLAAPGKPLVDIEDPTTLQIDADVPEAIASHIQRDSKLRVRVDAAHSEFDTVVAEIAPTADAVSRTFQVKLDLPAAAGVRPGQFARLLVPIGERQSVRVPAAALVQRGQLEIVFVASNHRAELHLVKSGKRVGDEIEIVSGLGGGKSVVISGAELLADGQPLEIE